MANNRQSIHEYLAERRKQRGPKYRVKLGISEERNLPVRIDIAELSTYIVGKPGTGKSNMLAHIFLANQDHSKILIDPAGKLTNEVILPNIEDPSRIIYFAPYEQRRRPLGFNPFDLGKQPSDHEKDTLVDSLRSIFAHVWLDSFRQYANMAMIIQNSLKLLVQFEGMTFVDMMRVLIDKPFRIRLASQLRSGTLQPLRNFWLKHYREDMGISTYNKLNEFVEIDIVMNSVCQRRSSFYLDQAMAEGKTIIVNLGGVPEIATGLLGGLFVSRILTELHRREQVPSDELVPFGVFVDEFDLFGGRSFETIISKCRQQKSSVCIAHQHWGQLSPSLQESVLQAAYVIAFEVSPKTADGMRRLFPAEADLINVPMHYAWVRSTKYQTGAKSEKNLIKTTKVRSGKPERIQEVKQQSWPLGRSVEEVKAEIGAAYGVIEKYNVSRTTEKPAKKVVRDEPVTEPPVQVQPARGENLPRFEADWPAGFRQRPPVVSNGLGK